jgi:iron complex transport system permease protein
MRTKAKLNLILSLLLLLAIAYLSLYWGVIWINPFGAGDETSRLILFKIRLPRILLAIFVGSGLSVSGVAFQAILRNPLADPYILGTSSGAALGGALALILGLGGFFYSLPAMAFVCALLSLVLVYRMAQLDGKMPVQTLLLAGVIVNTFLSGVITLLVTLNHKELYEVIFWIMGSLGQTDMKLILITGAITTLSCLAVYFFSGQLNIITLGEEKAQTLGVNVELTKRLLFIIVSVIIALLVSVCGMIGFVGLIIPHMARLLVGPDHKVLMPTAAILGAIFVLLCDGLARTAAAPLEIPIGVVTALFGAPFFLYLLRRKKSQIITEV